LTSDESADRSYPENFASAVDRVLRDEGGYASNPADPGGPTKFGISAREYPDLDIAALTRDDAIAIYYRDWWMRFDFGRLPGPIAAKCFDLAINIGALHAIRCVQRALRACGRQVAEDGLLGDETVRAAAAAEPLAILAALRSEAAGYYRATSALSRGLRADGDREFLDGWLNRAYE
jgi:lysozyme family protein